MIQKVNKVVLYTLVIGFLYSCEKEEGVGGTAAISGIVVEQNVNYYMSKIGKSKLATDKDVYIMYGDNTTVDDKIETSPSGEFSFKFLMPGKYTIYTLSDDTSNFNKQQIVISQIITIEDKDEEIKIDSLYTVKHNDVDDGVAQACGVVGQVEYYNGSTEVFDTIPAQDIDVYLMYEDSIHYDIDEKTNYYGSFCFNNLIPGKYKIYAYSEIAYSKKEAPIFVEFEITDTTTTIKINPVYISNF